MDLAKVQKINSLASELRKHHFADSSQDAFTQAEQTLEPEHVYHEGMDEPTEHHAHRQTSEELGIRKTELLIAMNNKKYEQEFALLRSAVQSLSEELSLVRSTIDRLAEQQPKEVQQPLHTEPVQKKEPHPRQGNTTPEDVDIQKMFYFGNK